MELRQLRYAALLAEHRSFRRAAEHAFITQSAFSQQIALLERDLGIRLFDRSSTGVSTTEAGEHFVEEAHAVLADLARMEQEARARARGQSGVLRVGIFGAGAGELTPLIVSRFRHAFPGVELQFRELTMSSQLDDITDETVDVAIVHPLFDSAAIALTTLLEEPRMAAVPVGHRLADAAELSVLDLANEPFVLASRGTPKPWSSFWACGDLWDTTASSRVEMNSIGEGLDAVAYMNVVDTVPSTSTRFHTHPGVAFIPLTDAIYSSVAVARLKDKAKPLAEAFCDLADQLAERHHTMVPGAVRPPVG